MFRVLTAESTKWTEAIFSFPPFSFYLIDMRSILIYITSTETCLTKTSCRYFWVFSSDQIRIFMSLCRLSQISNCVQTYDSAWIIDYSRLENRREGTSWWLLNTCLFNNKKQIKAYFMNDYINSSLRFYWEKFNLGKFSWYLRKILNIMLWRGISWLY